MARRQATDFAALKAERLETGRTVEQELAWLQAMAKLMDSRFEVLGIRFGVDALVGLIPVLGDLATLAAGTTALFTSVRLKLPWHVHARIFANLAADMGIGAVPVAGDAFDFFFRSHKRNVRLIERYILKRAAEPAKPD